MFSILWSMHSERGICICFLTCFGIWYFWHSFVITHPPWLLHQNEFQYSWFIDHYYMPWINAKMILSCHYNIACYKAEWWYIKGKCSPHIASSADNLCTSYFCIHFILLIVWNTYTVIFFRQQENYQWFGIDGISRSHVSHGVHLCNILVTRVLTFTSELSND